MNAQLDARGRLRHLLTLEGLPAPVLLDLLARARRYLRTPPEPAARAQILTGFTVANLFLEPSTRTRLSFELAARRLGAELVNLDNAASSTLKGESLLDTVHTLAAMRTDLFVLRTAEVGAPARVAEQLAGTAAVVSGGEAHLSHPTQGLLDVLTILLRKPELDRLTVCIVGDIAHSRVARSVAAALRTLRVRELRLVAPPELMPAAGEFAGATRCARVEEGLADADVVMALRIQLERMQAAELPDLASYGERYRITQARLAGARPDAIVMHPGPMNRGVEIDSGVADGPQSVIRAQVAAGVPLRMAVLEALAETLR